MTREQKIEEALRRLVDAMGGLVFHAHENGTVTVTGPAADGLSREALAIVEAVDGARAALSTPADAPAPSVSRMSSTCAYLSDGTKIVIRRDGNRAWMEHLPQDVIRLAAPPPRPDEDGECPTHGEKWIEGTDCPKCGGKRVWHSGMGSTTTDEHQRCLGPCGMDRYVDGIDA